MGTTDRWDTVSTKATGNENVQDSTWGPPRSRTITWRDPGPITAEGLSMAGLDYLLAMKNDELPSPPSASLIQMTIRDAEPGRVVVTCEPDESMYNATGLIHGGIVCMLLDTVAGSAVLSALPAGKGQTSVEIKVNYLRAVRGGTGVLTATGTVTKVGSRVGFAEGVVTDGKGAIVATASTTLLIHDL
jgi:uncharacterized protein (TIGR00369 family)